MFYFQVRAALNFSSVEYTNIHDPVSDLDSPVIMQPIPI